MTRRAARHRRDGRPSRCVRRLSSAKKSSISSRPGSAWPSSLDGSRSAERPSTNGFVGSITATASRISARWQRAFRLEWRDRSSARSSNYGASGAYSVGDCQRPRSGSLACVISSHRGSPSVTSTRDRASSCTSISRSSPVSTTSATASMAIADGDRGRPASTRSTWPSTTRAGARTRGSTIVRAPRRPRTFYGGSPQRTPEAACESSAS